MKIIWRTEDGDHRVGGHGFTTQRRGRICNVALSPGDVIERAAGALQVCLFPSSSEGNEIMAGDSRKRVISTASDSVGGQHEVLPSKHQLKTATFLLPSGIVRTSLLVYNWSAQSSINSMNKDVRKKLVKTTLVRSGRDNEDKSPTVKYSH